MRVLLPVQTVQTCCHHDRVLWHWTSLYLFLPFWVWSYTLITNYKYSSTLFFLLHYLLSFYIFLRSNSFYGLLVLNVLIWRCHCVVSARFSYLSEEMVLVESTWVVNRNFINGLRTWMSSNEVNLGQVVIVTPW